MTAAIPAICEEYPGCVRLNISEEEEEEEEGLFKADAVNEEDPEEEEEEESLFKADAVN